MHAIICVEVSQLVGGGTASSLVFGPTYKKRVAQICLWCVVCVKGCFRHLRRTCHRNLSLEKPQIGAFSSHGQKEGFHSDKQNFLKMVLG